MMPFGAGNGGAKSRFSGFSIEGAHFTRVGSTVRSCDRPPLAPQGVGGHFLENHSASVMVHLNQCAGVFVLCSLPVPPCSRR